MINLVNNQMNNQFVLDCREIEYDKEKQASFLVPLVSTSKSALTFSIKMDDSCKKYVI